MKTADAIAYYGSKRRLARALGISPPAVSQWGERVPRGRAFELQALTGGALRAETEPAHEARERTAPTAVPERRVSQRRALVRRAADRDPAL